ncbi:MAG: hypothetical protein IJO91_02900 [Oscillospiraceae bacterium]|nr:hypothetical protein [Oscillospiraceae bacterium]
MKAMLYTYLKLNTKYWIAAAVSLVFSIVLCVIFIQSAKEDPEAGGVAAMLLLLTPLFAPIMLAEPLGHYLEDSMKSRFVCHVLASKVTRHQFVLFYLLTDIITTLVGAGLVIINYVVFDAFDFEAWDLLPSVFILLAGTALVNWITLPLTISLKSTEKAGAIVGLVLGFGVVLPAMLIFVHSSEGAPTDQMIANLLSPSPETQAITYAVMAVLFVLFYFILYKRVKRGDL